MNETHQKALEAAVSHGFRKGDFTSLGHALIGECEQRTEVQERLSKQVAEVAQAVTDITGRNMVEFTNNREGIQAQIDSTCDDIDELKAALAGDENGVLRIQTLYVG